MVITKILQSENCRTPLTMSEKVNNVPSKFSQFLASTAATLSATAAGMCVTWSSPAIPMLQKEDSFLRITETQGAWVASLVVLGAAIGAIPTGAIANAIGRKSILQLLSLPIFLSWLMIAFSTNVYTIYIARILAGLALGAISVAAPMYVAEVAHISIRGTLGTFFQVQIVFGLLLEYILGGTIVDFKFLALASAILPVVFVVWFSFMPETPVYLYTRNRINDARDSLQYFRGPTYNVDDELTKIAEDIKEATRNKAKLSDLISCRATRQGLIISLGLMVFQQLSGINAVLFYAEKIFEDTGSSMSPSTCAILMGAVQVASTLLSTLLIDRAGRKILLFVSSSVMCVCLVTLGVYLHLKQTHDLAYLSVLPLACLALYIVVFSLGLGPIPWMILGEIFTPKTKGIASSVSAAVNWILAFSVTNQFENLADVIGNGFTFVIFGVICGFGTIFVGLLVPETKGKDIDQVQNLLVRGSALNCRRYKPRNTGHEEIPC